MSKWIVTVPVAGSITFTGIEAEDAEAAINVALGRELDLEQCDDLNMYEHVIEGNASNLDFTDAEAWEDDGDSDEDEEDGLQDCDGDCAHCDEEDCDDRDEEYEED